MPRIARIVVPGFAHHITQRGNNREPVFFDDDDRRAYLRFLRNQSREHGPRIIAYCLMDNHVHIVAIPRREDSLARAVGRAHWLYARHINQQHARSGHLWQNRFFSCALDGEHLAHAVRYTERNPVAARLVRLPWRYAWSSAAAHIGGTDPSNLLDRTSWRTMYAPAQWRRVLQQPEDESMTLRLERNLRAGRPLAGARSLARLNPGWGFA